MVEYNLSLDEVFGALADPTRRDILNRTALSELTVGEIAAVYDMSLAAVSKHLKVLRQAGLIVRRRRGKQLLVQAAPLATSDAKEYLEQYAALLNERLDKLEQYING
jgi:DNA-binding transcriptional ArsR family regulator